MLRGGGFCVLCAYSCAHQPGNISLRFVVDACCGESYPTVGVALSEPKKGIPSCPLELLKRGTTGFNTRVHVLLRAYVFVLGLGRTLLEALVGVA